MQWREPDDPRYTPIHLRRELVARGQDDRVIRRLVAGGSLARPRHGAYVNGKDWASLDDSGRHCVCSRAVVRQASTELVLSHSSALVEYDGPTFDVSLGEVDVTRPDGRSGRRERGIRQHHGSLDPGDIRMLHGAPLTGPAVTVLDMATVSSAEATLCIANHFLHERLTTSEELAAKAAARRRRPGMLAGNLALRLSDPRIESVGESRTVWLCFQQGLPAPVPQLAIRDRTGRVFARVDLAWPEHGVFVEFDGRIKYGRLLGPGQSLTEVIDAEKRREEEICRLTGWRCVRLVWADLDRPVRTARRIRGMFQSGRPGPQAA